jgi:hypothetical protein
MVYAGVLVEGEAGAELFSSLAGNLYVLACMFIVGKVAAVGHGIAIDSAHGVFLLASAVALR